MKFSKIYEPGISLACSKGPDTFPYPKSYELSSRHYIVFGGGDLFQHYPPVYVYVFEWSPAFRLPNHNTAFISPPSCIFPLTAPTERSVCL